ncbi:hypothetical protein CapIbe_001747 [Capra ibex]
MKSCQKGVNALVLQRPDSVVLPQLQGGTGEKQRPTFSSTDGETYLPWKAGSHLQLPDTEQGPAPVSPSSLHKRPDLLSPASDL